MKGLVDRVVYAVTGERRRTRRGGRRRTDNEPNIGWLIVLALAVPIAMFDWISKWLIVQTIPLGQLRVVLSDRVALWHVKNPALVLGLHGDLPVAARKVLVSIYATVAVLLLIAVLNRGHRLLPHRRKWAWLFLGMVAGGMLGNLGERVVHWSVTDFLSFRWGEIWLPPGNLADLSILVAMPIAMCVLLFELEARTLRHHTAAKETPVAEVGSARAEVTSAEA